MIPSTYSDMPRVGTSFNVSEAGSLEFTAPRELCELIPLIKTLPDRGARLRRKHAARSPKVHSRSGES